VCGVCVSVLIATDGGSDSLCTRGRRVVTVDVVLTHAPYSLPLESLSAGVPAPERDQPCWHGLNSAEDVYVYCVRHGGAWKQVRMGNEDIVHCLCHWVACFLVRRCQWVATCMQAVPLCVDSARARTHGRVRARCAEPCDDGRRLIIVTIDQRQTLAAPRVKWTVKSLTVSSSVGLSVSLYTILSC